MMASDRRPTGSRPHPPNRPGRLRPTRGFELRPRIQCLSTSSEADSDAPARTQLGQSGSLNTTRPPGRNVRPISTTTSPASAMCWSVRSVRQRSRQPFLIGRARPSAITKATPVRPCRCCASMTFRELRSSPTANTSEATVLIASASSPVPHPTSRTRLPGSIASISTVSALRRPKN
jgi:hypothetical protein